ncbi:phosphocholine cytidylyltransferase family protein [Actinomadura rupiterrae]|uniref:phosphocholine cytidylyltransferase family protein n=1 Tax=Actinomadura rupiterrae TaxID=559627 RepID=UPI0020A6068F|nr:phosphocholine cytidylyltransferase family protein [Actinomadura rupiterrae]MCP2337299.1 choline kinase [Actinomadura rupiterrae]
MKGLILAAGRGSRFAPFTADRPKCLVQINGRTLLDRQVAALTAAGVGEIGLVTGWSAEAFAHTGLRRFDNPRWAETTMVESAAAARSWLAREQVVVSYGDIVYTADTVRALLAASGPLALSYDPHWRALWERRFERPLDDAETFRHDADGRLLEIGGRPAGMAEVMGQYIGLLRFTPDAWAAADEVARDAGGGLDMTGLLRELLRRRRLPITVVPTRGPWWEFDHPSDIEAGMPVLRDLDAVAP